MVLKLDPRYPLVWRSPTSLQFGVDSPIVVLDDVSANRERMISALVVGVSRSGLDMLATRSDSGTGDTDALLRELAPALERPETPTQPTVTIAGTGVAVDRTAEALASSGVTTRLVGNDPALAVLACDLAVVFAHFVIDPQFHGIWLRRDLTHLPVVFGDTGARIGPIVEPGIGPCLYCLERQHTDADPAWPAIASQLWGRRSRIDAGLVATEVAAIAARLVLARLRRGMQEAAASVRLDAATGTIESTLWNRHPDCACAALPGSGTAGEQRTRAARPRPRTGSGAVALA